MNCEKCQELLGEFLEGTLAERERAAFGAHLEECLGCASMRDELGAIVAVARDCRDYEAAPPNSRAMWLRIRNTLEGELEAAERAAASARLAASSSGRESLWSRWMNRRWELSLPQLAAAVAAVAVFVSLATAVGVRGWRAPELASGDKGRSARDAGFDAASDALYHRAYLQQQEARISYWKQHIEQRKASWNPQMRNAFERSMSVIDAAVNESVSELERNPHDEVTQEMLDSALRDKAELLREFSEQ